MDLNQVILPLILFLPLFFSLLVIVVGKFAGDEGAKWSALIFSLIVAALTIGLWVMYPAAAADAAGYRFGFDVPWLVQINSNFHLVVDGQTTVETADDICDRIEQALKTRVPGAMITLHVEPEHKAKHSGVLVI